MPDFVLTRREIDRILKRAHAGDLSPISALKSRHPDFHWSVLKYPNTGDTILHCAARLGHLDTVRYLISFRPSGVDCKNNDDKTALHEAAQFSQTHVVRLLLDSGARIDALKRADWTPLMLACTKHDLETVRILVDDGALVNFNNKDGWTSLHLAARTGNEDIVCFLKDKGGDCGARTKNGRSVLHIAALHGNANILRVLLELNLDINVEDNCGNTPLHEAVLGRHIHVIKLLIANDARVDCRNNVDFNLLHLASSEGYDDLVEFLVGDLGFDMNSTTCNGFSALHCSARKKQTLVYRLLIKLGCDAHITDNWGRVAADYLTNFNNT